jgi:hypothetical protein
VPNRPRPKNATKPPVGSTAVVRLQDFKAVRHAAAVLEGLLHEPPWLRDVRGSVAGGQARIVVRLRYFAPAARVCTPTQVNSIPVQIEWEG